MSGRTLEGLALVAATLSTQVGAATRERPAPWPKEKAP